MTDRLCERCQIEAAQVGERFCADCMIANWIETYIKPAEPQTLTCGHLLWAAHYSQDGTAYCMHCEAERAG